MFYSQLCQQLQRQAEQALARAKAAEAQFQVDGVRVMEKDKSSKGLCEGREVKQVYPLERPQERHRIACR